MESEAVGLALALSWEGEIVAEFKDLPEKQFTREGEDTGGIHEG